MGVPGVPMPVVAPVVMSLVMVMVVAVMIVGHARIMPQPARRIPSL